MKCARAIADGLCGKPAPPGFKFLDCSLEEYPACPEHADHPPRRPLLVWTKTPPSTPGWYWCRGVRGADVTPEVVLVGRTAMGVLVVSATNFSTRLPLATYINWMAEWAGPIAPPEEMP
jgi:hypothetical protein